ETPSMRGKAIDTILSTLFEKNPREEQHSRRVSELCCRIGREMGLSETELNKLKVIGLVHDIGKIALSEDILNKTSALSKMEREEIMRHPEIGHRILKSTDELSELAEHILMHHERLDGSGYPRGLSGSQIPMLTRILSVADAYDAMISDRPYRGSISHEGALSELIKNAGTQFDEEVVNVLSKIRYQN
ncbi:MAG: HD-GYP domain-containing protein, partial [Bacillota bacterium]|nr:HD-GYP domain-containing protein [Bacillota bacterium]